MSHRSANAAFQITAAAALGAAVLSGCPPPPSEGSPDGGNVGPGASERRQFVLSLVLSEAPPAPPAARGPCELPIRSQMDTGSAGLPEPGLTATLSRAGTEAARAVTGPLGVASLSPASAGLHALTLVTSDTRAQARIVVDLQVPRTVVRGFVGSDREDLDGDGDRSERVVVAEVLPDADADRTSDVGTKALWICGERDGVAYGHLGGGWSERSRLGAELERLDTTAFADRDGDWIPDARDADADGDGVADVLEAASLPCPGFSHASLATPGSLHEAIPCSMCHLDRDPLPLACHDCHADIGRLWLSSPEPLPDGHFLTDCDQCHPADAPWNAITGTGGELHEIYPLDGAHRITRCFACHPTGNIATANTCSGCHDRDTPPGHYDGACDACHGTDSWTSFGGASP